MSETTEKEPEDERMGSVETERELRQRIQTYAIGCLYQTWPWFSWYGVYRDIQQANLAVFGTEEIRAQK